VQQQQAAAAGAAERRSRFGAPVHVDEAARARSAAAVQQLGDPAQVGVRLMAQMNYGVAGRGLGRAGQVPSLSHISCFPALLKPKGRGRSWACSARQAIPVGLHAVRCMYGLLG
jgi:hypothetical protein